MTHIAHLGKKFKSINTYDYIIMLKTEGKIHYLLFENLMVPYSNKLESLHPTVLCAKFGWNWPSGSGEDFKNFVNVV